MTTTTGSRRGRPRNEAVDDQILETTRRLLAEDGYTRMTVDSVAKAVGVTRPTIYLRWPSKEQLVIAAISDLERPAEAVRTGDTLNDLKVVLRQVQVSFVDHQNAELLGPLQSERKHSPALYQEFKSRLLTPRRQSIRALLEEGVTEGHLDPDINIDAAVNSIIGSLYAKLMTSEEVPADFADQVIDTLWRGLRATS